MIKTNVSQTNIVSLCRMSSVSFYFISCYCKVMVSLLKLISLMALTSQHFSLADGGMTYPGGCYEDEPEKAQVKCYVLSTW